MLASERELSERRVSMKSSPCVVIAGAGDVGSRLAALRALRGDEVIALRRRDVQTGVGIRAVQADLATGDGLKQLPRQPDALVFCAAPDERNEAAYRALYLDGLRRLLDACDAGRVIFVSSTAVYAEDAGEWVNEATPTRPLAFNGRALLDAEHVLDAHVQAVVLRLSGLYGPGRDAMLRRARTGEGNRPHWSNRLHVDDAASALSCLLDLVALERRYLGSDDCPARECDIQNWLREREALPELPSKPGVDSGRRVCNKLLRAAGWLPRYPDFRAGYAPLLAPAGV